MSVTNFDNVCLKFDVTTYGNIETVTDTIFL